MSGLFTLPFSGTALIQILTLQKINPPILKKLIKMSGFIFVDELLYSL